MGGLVGVWVKEQVCFVRVRTKHTVCPHILHEELSDKVLSNSTVYELIFA